MKNALVLFLLFLLTTVGRGGAASSDSLTAALKDIQAVGPEGHGNAEAAAAWKQLSAASAASLPAILAAMDGANDLALNWLRAAVDSIAARELAARKTLPVPALENFIGDTKHHPRARRLAYELIARSDPAVAASLMIGMLNDPSNELRRDAVQRVADEAGKLRAAGRTNEAVPKLQIALKSARDVDQVEGLARQLQALGHPVELPKVFGWLAQWKVIGPFDNTSREGFDQRFPPEENLDFNVEYAGKSGKVRWQEFKAEGDYGLVDLNKPCGMLKEVTGYACAEFQSDQARPVELRLGCKNGWKIWLNGKFLFGRDEYHRGAEIDQYRLKADLKPGKNVILVKLCQNEQKEDWTKEWEFQLRVTDALGTPIVSAQP